MTFEGLPTGDLDTVRRSLELIQLLRGSRSESQVRELAYFFLHALRPFYDCMWEGMTSQAGHVIYRLSDLVSEELRRTFQVYPSQGGWDTLEDFRREWEELHPEGIPALQDVLPESIPLKGLLPGT